MQTIIIAIQIVYSTGEGIAAAAAAVPFTLLTNGTFQSFFVILFFFNLFLFCFSPLAFTLFLSNLSCLFLPISRFFSVPFFLLVYSAFLFSLYLFIKKILSFISYIHLHHLLFFFFTLSIVLVGIVFLASRIRKYIEIR